WAVRCTRSRTLSAGSEPSARNNVATPATTAAAGIAATSQTIGSLYQGRCAVIVSMWPAQSERTKEAGVVGVADAGAVRCLDDECHVAAALDGTGRRAQRDGEAQHFLGRGLHHAGVGGEGDRRVALQHDAVAVGLLRL